MIKFAKLYSKGICGPNWVSPENREIVVVKCFCTSFKRAYLDSWLYMPPFADSDRTDFTVIYCHSPDDVSTFIAFVCHGIEPVWLMIAHHLFWPTSLSLLDR